LAYPKGRAKGKGKGGVAMQVLERTEGHYDVRKVEFGTVYRWCPDCVVVECECSERLLLTHAETSCEECGIDHADFVREELAARRPEDETLHPWRYRTRDHDYVGMPC
jgi:hypothetical protein